MNQESGFDRIGGQDLWWDLLSVESTVELTGRMECVYRAIWTSEIKPLRQFVWSYDLKRFVLNSKAKILAVDSTNKAMKGVLYLRKARGKPYKGSDHEIPELGNLRCQ